MKASIPLLSALLGFVGAYGGYQLSSTQDQPGAPATPALEPSSSLVPEVASNPVATQELERQIAEVRNQLMRLEERANRVEREVVAEPLAAAESTSTSGGVVPSSEERSRILAVIAQEEERQRHERELVREERLLANVERDAVKITAVFNLPPGSEAQIVSVLLEENEQIDAIKARYKQTGMARTDRASKELLREEIREARNWRDEKLTSLFGQDLSTSDLKSRKAKGGALSPQALGEQADSKSGSKRSKKKRSKSSKD